MERNRKKRGASGLGLCLFALVALSIDAQWVEFNDYSNESVDAPPFEGVLVLEPKGLDVVEHQRMNWFPPVRGDLPKMNLEIVYHDGVVIPVERGLVTTQHPHFDYIASAGSVWQDGGKNWVGLPFTLINRFGNCTHNGVFNIRYDFEKVYEITVSINQETCHFVQFDMKGSVAEFSFESKTIPKRDDVIQQYEREENARIPTATIQELEEQTGSDIGDLMNVLPQDDGLSILGVYYDGVHYTTECRTRGEPYPYCDQMLFTSFSTAKSAFPALVLMELAQQYGLDVYTEQISEYLPEVEESKGVWENVSFDHVGDMTSGNFEIDDPMADPTPANFYADISAAEKLSAALVWENGAPAGTKFIYQTADTFILTSALNRFLHSKNVEPSDSFDYLVEKAMRPLHLTPEVMASRRTREDGVPNAGTAFGGMGMWWNRDGIVRLAKFMSIDHGKVGENQILHPTALAETLQRKEPPKGIATKFFGAYYNNGIWALPIHEVLPNLFSCDVWVPYMSGLSGVRVSLFPNDTIIYYFNDTQSFPIIEAAVFANQLKSFCEE